MARRGRKRKHVERQPNGQPKRTAGPDRGTPEFRAHRLKLVGAANAADHRAESALGILELAGLITASQNAAGAAWARAMYLTYGKPYPGCMNLDGMPRGTSDGPPEKQQRIAEAGAAALDRCGYFAVREVRRIAWQNSLPDWYRWDRSADEMRENGWCRAFVAGMAALETVI